MTMTNKKPAPHTKEPLEMSGATKKRLQSVAAQFKGKEMFPEKVERARQMFKGLQVRIA